MVICVSWDQSLINYPLSFSAMTLLVGSLTRKIVSEMTYIVSSGTLNPTILYYTMLSRPLPTSAVLLPPPGRFYTVIISSALGLFLVFELVELLKKAGALFLSSSCSKFLKINFYAKFYAYLLASVAISSFSQL